MTYNVDEPIAGPSNVSGDKPVAFEAGKTQLTIINKPEAPLEKTDLKVLLELTESEDIKERSAVDVVMVLDVSSSMRKEDRIGKLKIATQFVIRKLGHIDRLSIVTFSEEPKRLFALRKINDKSLDEIIDKVKDLKLGSGTNIAAGLKEAIQVLNDRVFNDGRVGSIMLMSDGQQNLGNAREVEQLDKFSVHAFGLGKDSKTKKNGIKNVKSMLLNDIAKASSGGTFSDVQNEEDLSKAFSQCLAGLLTVVVQDLNLTITPADNESEIRNVSAGNYEKTENDQDLSVTISFGQLYKNEVRTIMVDLLLYATEIDKSTDVLHVSYKYSAGKGKRPFDCPPVTITVTRTGEPVDKEIPKLILEENRLQTVQSVKDARGMADEEENLPGGKKKVEQAKTSLEGVKVEEDPCKLIETLIYEMRQLSEFMTTQKEYEEKGRPYAMSFETSHDRQRYAARGDVDKVRSFATPRMNAYLEQAKKFKEDPTKPPPSEADDVEQDIHNDPRVAPDIIQRAIQFGKSAFQVGKSIIGESTIGKSILGAIKKNNRGT